MELFGNDAYWMQKALELARKALKAGEVPVGAVLVHDNEIVGKGFNQTERLCDGTAHAEMMALTSASDHFKNWRLEKTTLFVTKEPCLMCAGAILNCRVPRVVFGAVDDKEGAAGSRYDVMRERGRDFVEVIPGICAFEGQQLLTQFFKNLRSH